MLSGACNELKARIMPCIFSSLYAVLLVVFLTSTLTQVAADADGKLSADGNGNVARDVQSTADKNTAINDGDSTTGNLSSNEGGGNNLRIRRLRHNLIFLDLLVSAFESFREQWDRANESDVARRSDDAVDGFVGRVVADTRREDVVDETAAMERGRQSKKVHKRRRRRRRRQAAQEESNADDRSSKERLVNDRLGVEERAVADRREIQHELGREEELAGHRDVVAEDVDWNADERDSQERDISYDYIFGHGTDANDDALEQVSLSLHLAYI